MVTKKTPKVVLTVVGILIAAFFTSFAIPTKLSSAK